MEPRLLRLMGNTYAMRAIMPDMGTFWPEAFINQWLTLTT